MKRMKQRLLVGLGFGLAVVGSVAHAEEGLKSSLSAGETGAGSAAGAEGNFYIPGMPIPKPDAAKGAGDATEERKSGGVISKITVVDRSNATDPKERPPAPEIYQGIIPGSRNSHARTDRDRVKAERKHTTQNSVYWVGFNPATAEKGSEVFVQTLLLGAVYDVATADKDGQAVVELTIKNATVKRRNDLRALDTRFWPGLVSSVQAQRRGRDVVVVITLEAPAGYEVRQSEDFIFIDFKDPDASPPGTL
jgi:hypothetical protein